MRKALVIAAFIADFAFLAACTAHFAGPELPLARWAGERAAVFDQGSFAQGFRPMAFRREQETYQKIERTQSGYSLEYGFKNFNGDGLVLSARLNAEEVAASIREFGIKQEDIDGLDRWYEKAQKDAIEAAKKRSFSGRVTAKNREELDLKLRELQARNDQIGKDLDQTLASLSAEYRNRRLDIYQSSGFRYQKAGVIEVDIPALARRNIGRVRPVAEAFDAIAANRGYQSESLVGAVAAMVQTSLRYEIPAQRSGTKLVNGVMAPPKTLVLGQGDCDTKAALIASILKNWPNLKLVGLAIPQHYLMAVHRIPRRGDAFIEHEGLPYVMIEAAGPAWLMPGQVGDSTMAYLESGKQFRIQPM
ncbi:MAG: hypothetical protein HY922_14040 [Elusimicrobia bacterium]|nr:hypothetical protein [Elusimicrobiota bacterium]